MVTFSRKGNTDRPFYCCKECYREDNSVGMIQKDCLFCKSKFITKDNKDGRKCCSVDCARKYSSSFSPHEGNSDSLKLWRMNRPPSSIKELTLVCVNCGDDFKVKSNRRRKCCSSSCSTERISKGGRNSVSKQGKVRRSKNEIHFHKLCDSHFKGVTNNEQKFNGWDADVIIESEKVAILWNGKWHYSKIKKNHSVSQVQNRDKIKVDEIKKLGYTPYVIKDMGKENPSFVISEFEKLKEFIAASHSGRLHCSHKAV